MNKDNDFNINDAWVNLEPPKIYNEAQEKPRHSSKKKSASAYDGMSTAEKRSKQNQKRRLKNSVRKALLAALLALVLIATGIVLSLTVFFKIENINVSGSGMYSTEEIINYCAIDAGDNLFLIDKEKASRNLEQRLPYIYSVEIKREPPSTLNIMVTEATPAYYIKNEDGTLILLDDNFKVLNNNSAETPEAAIEIRYAEAISIENGLTIEFENEDVAMCLHELSDIIKRLNISEATAIASNGGNDNYIIYENRIRLRLGSINDLETKVYRGLAACEKMNESNPKAKGTFDLSSGKQFYFTAE